MKMVRKTWVRALVVGVMCAAMCSGCRRTKVGPETDPFELDPMGGVMLGDGVGLDGLGETRFSEDGRLVGAEYEVEPVYFDYDSFRVKDAELVKIQQVAEMLRADRGMLCVTEGNCDERGSREYNMSLGEHRALAIRASLISQGIDGTRIQTRSFGEENPATEGHDEGAWRLNRRVEFVFYRQ